MERLIRNSFRRRSSRSSFHAPSPTVEPVVVPFVEADVQLTANGADPPPWRPKGADGADTATNWRDPDQRHRGGTGNAPKCNGENAPAAKDGEFGGRIELELSSTVHGQILVSGTVGAQTMVRKFVPSGRRLLLESRGGGGQDGGEGGRGGSGEQGRQGKDATQSQPGSNGRSGGSGGNGGHGSNGGRGGRGGDIVIIVSERNMHLLAAVVCDVSGGKGGRPGIHGQGGPGGEGGLGGRPYRRGSKQVQDGGHNGSPGRTGYTPNAQLAAGGVGKSGRVMYVVNYDDGRSETYQTKYDVRLLGFDVVDELEDNVFEPGECLRVRNIRVRNTGQMPTPKWTPIPIQLKNGPWLSQVQDRDIIYVPPSIPGGETTVIEGELWAKIQRRADSTPGRSEYHEETVVELQAIVPGPQFILQNFEEKKKIPIRYPVAFKKDGFQYLDSIECNSFSTIKSVVENKSRHELGAASQQGRPVWIRLSCPGAAPVNLTHNVSEVATEVRKISYQETPLLKRQAAHVTSQWLRTFRNITDGVKVTFLVELLISHVASAVSSHNTNGAIVIQAWDLDCEICAPYNFNPASEFLLITHPNVPEGTLTSWKAFIQSDLQMSVDVWNVSLNGGLETEDQQSVLRKYPGKAILGFCDPFELQGQYKRSLLDYIDPLIISELAQQETSFVFLEQSSKFPAKQVDNELKRIILSQAVDGRSSIFGDVCHQFKSVRDFCQELGRGFDRNSRSASGVRHYLITEVAPKQANAIEELKVHLQASLPLDKVFMCHMGDNKGISVLPCSSRSHSIRFARLPRASATQSLGRLTSLEAYICVASLPLKRRLRLLLPPDSDLNDRQPGPNQAFGQSAARLSIMRELHDQAVRTMASLGHSLSQASTSFALTPCSLLGQTNDKIATTLSYIMSSQKSVSSEGARNTEELLLSLALSCYSQDAGLLSRMGWMQRQVRQELLDRIAELYTSQKTTQTQNSRTRFDVFKSKLDKRRKEDHDLTIENNIRTLVNHHSFFTRDVFRTAGDVEPDVLYVPIETFQDIRADYAMAAIKRGEDLKLFQHLRHRLLGERPPREVNELPAEIPRTPSISRKQLPPVSPITEFVAEKRVSRSDIGSRMRPKVTVMPIQELDGEELAELPGCKAGG